MAWLTLFRAAVPLAVVLAACGSTPAASPASSPNAKPAATASANPATSAGAKPAASAKESGEGSGKQEKLGNVTFNDHGTQDLSGKSTFELEADTFYFGPTFLKGTPGEKVTLKIGNDSSAPHTFTAPSLKIDQDIPQGKDVDIQLTFPQSGTAYFYCKYHQASGMNGELLVGNASPQPPSSGGAAATGGSTGATSSPNSTGGSGY